MKNNLLLLLFVSCSAFAQTGNVGINTTDPKATLHVVGLPTDAAALDGIIAPKLTGNELFTKNYTNNQTGAMVYVTAAASTANQLAALSQVVNVSSAGYYYFDGSVWQKVNNGSGDGTNDAWINDATNTMVKLGTKADGNIRTSGTDFVIKDDGRVAIGTSSPDTNALLDLTSNTKAFLPPRLSLLSTDNPSPLSAHTQGAVVYNIATAGTVPSNVIPGLYINDGTKWSLLNSSTQKSASYFGTVNYGDINGFSGTVSNLGVSGFVVSASKTDVSGGDALTVIHNLNLSGNQNITLTIKANTTGASYGQYNNDNDWYQPVIYDVTANSFKVYVEENSSTVQNVSMMIQLTNY